MRYQGPYDGNKIREFVITVAENTQRKQQFSSELVKEDPRGGIPAYTIGHPLKGDDEDVCYLEFSEAYTEIKKR